MAVQRDVNMRFLFEDTCVTGRFAPTPSGRMHIGNIYAMLAAWLSARSQRGRMLLRIEDIDTPRVLLDADQWIMDDLTWLGMDWDGEPAYQSQRHEVYERALAALSEMCVPSERHAPSGRHALRNAQSVPSQSVLSVPLIYPCFCSRADIRAASAPQEGDRFVVYPGTCRRLWLNNSQRVQDRLKAGDRHSLRIAMPDQGDPCGRCTFTDRVYGMQSFDLAYDLGDTVVRRADGLFAYQLVVTVDDLLMGVNDIVRGRDLLRSTAVQLFIRECLVDAGFAAADIAAVDIAAANSATAHASASITPIAPIVPNPGLMFAHLPLIDNAAGHRLAKRERSLDMGALRKRGIAPERVIGYCAWLLGLIDEPEPCMPRDLLADFSWERVAVNVKDRCVPDDPFA